MSPYIAPPIDYSLGDGPPFMNGDSVVVQVNLLAAETPPGTESLSWIVRDPSGVEHDYSSQVTFPQGPLGGVLQLEFIADTAGDWYWKLVANGPSATEVVEDNFQVQDNYATTDPTDLHVLVPRARRYVEGPYGPIEGKPPLSDTQLYEMSADALGDIILQAGSVWWNTLTVTARDPARGYPIGWATSKLLEEWEAALITSQVALNYFFHLFLDYKTSVTIMNEGTSYAYTLSANVLRDYIASLQAARDNGLAGLVKHHPVMDTYASNIRVRDQATVAALEWWDTNTRDAAGGLPGGQEAYAIPFINGDPWGGYGG